MATAPVELLGTLTADGTLVLDDTPDLPPGRVQVILLPLASTRHNNEALAQQSGRSAEDRHGAHGA